MWEYLAVGNGWPSRFRSVAEMPTEVGDGLYHLLQWEITCIQDEGQKAQSEARAREEMERLRKASFG